MNNSPDQKLIATARLILFSAIVAATVFIAVPRTAVAQATGTKSGSVVSATPTPTPATTKLVDLKQIDFGNFTYPDITGASSTVKLVKGRALGGRLSLRRTYFFEITNDKSEEAVAMLRHSLCEFGCEESTRFFVYSAAPENPRLSFRFATGEGFSCGLKSANFSVSKIAIETFGDCRLKDEWIAEPNPVTPKSAVTTKFTFELADKGIWIPARELSKSVPIDLAEFRPKISFGDTE